MNNNNYFTLQLSVGALELLFKESGPDFVVKLRQAVIEEFCRRRISALVPKAYNDLAEAQVKAELVKEIGKIEGYGSNIQAKLSPAFKTQIETVAKEAVRVEFIALINEARKIATEQAATLKKDIQTVVETKIDVEVRKLIDVEVKRKLAEVAGNLIR